MNQDPAVATADFVVVGAGTSCMGLLHKLLSEYANSAIVPFTIAVVDPGIGMEEKQNSDKVSQLPCRWFRLAHESATVYPAVTDKNRIIDIPMGSGRGGTSRINASLCIPPRRQDFEQWPEPWKSEILPAVNQIQEFMYDHSALYHSHVNTMDETTTTDHPSLPNPYIPTPDNPLPWKETVFPSVAHHIPCTVDPTTLHRRDYYRALVEPLLREHRHLANVVQWIPGRVERLLFRETRVIGVEYFVDTAGGLQQIHANKQVILCAGAVESPALLLSSGIGWVDDVVVQRIRDYPGAVGHHLRDHIMLPRAVLTWKAMRASPGVNGVQSLYQLPVGTNLFQVAVMDSSVYTDILPHMVAGLVRYRFINLAPVWNRVWTNLSWLLFRVIKFCIVHVIKYTPIIYLLKYHVRTVTMFHMNSQKTGQVALKLKQESGESDRHGRSDFEVEIDLAYTTDTDSVECLFDGWIATGTVCPQGLEIFPGSFIRNLHGRTINQRRFRIFAEASTLSYYHLCGTCAMQTNEADDTWVVDSSLKLRGLNGISVCDASVFPTTVSVPTALTCAGIGRVFGSIMLREYVDEQKG